MGLGIKREEEVELNRLVSREKTSGKNVFVYVIAWARGQLRIKGGGT